MFLLTSTLLEVLSEALITLDISNS